VSIRRVHVFHAGLILLAFAMVALAYTDLPPLVPTHWGLDGKVTRFRPRIWAFAIPTLMVLIYALLLALPRISPRGYEIERFGRVFEICQSATLLVMLALTTLVLLAGLGADVHMDRAPSAIIGLLFIVLGNFQGKVTRNFFVGMRTPWTLASDEVWLRTNRLAGKLMVVAGAGLLLCTFLDAGPAPLLVAAATIAGVPFVYSYVIYRKLEG